MEELDIKVLQDIVERTGGSYENMNYSDKINMIFYCRKLLKEINENIEVVKIWAGIDINSINQQERLHQKEADMIKVKNILNDIKPNLLDNINIDEMVKKKQVYYKKEFLGGLNR